MEYRRKALRYLRGLRKYEGLATRALTSTFVYIAKIDLTSMIRSAWQSRLKAAKPSRQRRVARQVAATLTGIGLCLIGTSVAEAPNASALGLDAKSYARIMINDKNQFQCINKLYYYESRWNPKASNGSHYGIPQGKSEYLKRANPIQQVQWGLRYVEHRYGSPCLALNHFKKWGWH